MEKVVLTDETTEKAIVPRKDPDGKHMSLFLCVSTAGEVVRPYTLLHCGNKDFVDERRLPIRCSRRVLVIWTPKPSSR